MEDGGLFANILKCILRRIRCNFLCFILSFLLFLLHNLCIISESCVGKQSYQHLTNTYTMCITHAHVSGGGVGCSCVAECSSRVLEAETGGWRPQLTSGASHWDTLAPAPDNNIATPSSVHTSHTGRRRGEHVVTRQRAVRV